MVPAGISYAITMRIGQHYGAGQLLDARLAGRVGIAFGAAAMLGFAMVFWLLPNQLVGLFLDHNDPAFREVIDLAVSLLAVAAWFELFDGTQTIAMGCIRGLKDAKTTFLVGPGLLLADRRAGRLVDGVPLGLGADGRLVGLGAGAGVRGGESDAGV